MHSRDLSFVREEAGEQRKRSNKFFLNLQISQSSNKNIGFSIRDV